MFEKEVYGDFPGGAVVKNPPANAGDMGSIPDLERSHMPQGNYARAPQLLKPARHTREATSPQREAHATATKSSSHSPQPEKARMQQWRPNVAKKREK